MWKCLLRKENFELGFEVREGGEILQTSRQRISDGWSNETERTVVNRFETAFGDFRKSLARRSEGAWSLICAERSWKVREKCTVEVTVGKSCDLVFAAAFYRQPVPTKLELPGNPNPSFRNMQAKLHCLPPLPSGVATIIIFIILLPLCVICVSNATDR